MKNHNLIMISQDTDLFLAAMGLNVIGDALARHIKYADILRSKSGCRSKILVITYVPRKYYKFHKKKFVQDGLIIIPSFSYLRLFFFLDVMRILLNELSNGFQPNLITTQNPWGEGLIALIISKIIKCNFLPQLHTDITSHYWLKRKPLLRAIRKTTSIFVLKKSKIIRLVSNSQKKKIAKYLLISKTKLKVVPVAITLKENNKKYINYPKNKEDLNRKTILFIGRFDEVKDLNLWVETAKQINSIFPKVVFKMIGNGPQFDEIKLKVDKLNLTESFTFTGAIPSIEINEHFTKNTILLLTSHYEGFGRVLVEAMSNKIPCISTECTGPNDIIVNKKSGYIIKERKPTIIANACCKLIKDKNLYEKMSKNSYLKFKNNFEFKKISDNYVQLLLEGANLN